MKRCIYSCFGFLVCLGALLSCDSMVAIVPESEIGTVKPKLVVHAYISPKDTLIRVFVTESVPVFSDIGGQVVAVEDAEVLLSNGNREAALIYDSTLQSYTVGPEQIGGIQAGATYRLVARNKDRSVEAFTTIPSVSPAITSYQIDTSYVNSGDGNGRDTTLAVEFTWTDPVGAGNFYRVSGSAVVIMDYREYESEGTPVTKRGRATIPLYWDSGFENAPLQSDRNRDGTTMRSPTGRVRLNRPVFFNQDGLVYAERPNEVRSVTLELLQTDEAYYRYQESIRQYDGISGNPFAEPVLLYSNIRGGLGVFASYNSFSIDIKP